MSTLHRTWVAGAPSGQRLGVVVQADKQCAEHLDLLGGETGQGHFLIAFGQRRNLPRQGCALWRQAKADCPAIEIASLPRNKALLYEPINDTGQRLRVDRGVCDQFRKALVRFVSQRRADAPFTQTEIKRLERFGEGLPHASTCSRHEIRHRCIQVVTDLNRFRIHPGSQSLSFDIAIIY